MVPGYDLRLLARTDRSGQTAVVNAIVVVPQRLAQLDPLAKDFDLFLRSGRCIGRQEMQIDDGIEIFVVSILQNCLKNVLAQIAHRLAHLSQQKSSLLPDTEKNLVRISYREGLFPTGTQSQGKYSQDFWGPAYQLPRLRGKQTLAPGQAVTAPFSCGSSSCRNRPLTGKHSPFLDLQDRNPRIWRLAWWGKPLSLRGRGSGKFFFGGPI